MVDGNDVDDGGGGVCGVSAAGVVYKVGSLFIREFRGEGKN